MIRQLTESKLDGMVLEYAIRVEGQAGTTFARGTFVQVLAAAEKLRRFHAAPLFYVVRLKQSVRIHPRNSAVQLMEIAETEVYVSNPLAQEAP